MDAKQRARLDATRRALALLKGRDFRNDLRDVAAEAGTTGEVAPVVVLGDDTIGYMCKRVTAHGGAAPVIIVEGGPENRLSVLGVGAVRPHSATCRRQPDIVNDASTVSMLLATMIFAGRGHLNFRLVGADTTMEMVGPGEELVLDG